MTESFILDLENKIHGIKTRLKELHYSADSMSLHEKIDDFYKEFDEFDDNIMENAQALWGTIIPGSINPELPESKEFEELLEDIRGILVSIKRKSEDSIMWTGIINIVDDFYTTVNRYIYLVKIIKKEK